MNIIFIFACVTTRCSNEKERRRNTVCYPYIHTFWYNWWYRHCVLCSLLILQSHGICGTFIVRVYSERMDNYNIKVERSRFGSSHHGTTFILSHIRAAHIQQYIFIYKKKFNIPPHSLSLNLVLNDLIIFILLFLCHFTISGSGRLTRSLSLFSSIVFFAVYVCVCLMFGADSYNKTIKKNYRPWRWQVRLFHQITFSPVNRYYFFFPFLLPSSLFATVIPTLKCCHFQTKRISKVIVVL